MSHSQSKQTFFYLGAVLLLVQALTFAARGDAVLEIKPTLLDDAVIGYATFQSHNQKVVSHPEAGIFLSYVKTRNEAYTAQLWRLMRSVDGGESFSVLYEATDATNPPALEIDTAGNLYLLRMNFESGDALVYRFLRNREYKEPEITTIPNAMAGKYCMLLDEERGRLYVFSHNNTFHVLTLDGALKSSVHLLKEGADGMLQYPHLTLGTNGELHAAWTTQKHGVYLYWDIHHMMSLDGGETWRNLGSTTKIELPAVADQHGPVRRISGEDEYEVHTWLSSVAYNRDKLHFMYLTQSEPQKENYIRLDAKTGLEELRLSPTFASEDAQIKSLDGFFCVEKSLSKPDVFAIGGYQGHLTILQSPDNGNTWRKHAEEKVGRNLYSIGGCRYLSEDGYILGTFTDNVAGTATTGQLSKLYFMKVAAAVENAASNTKTSNKK